jgi:hypothetical protein
MVRDFSRFAVELHGRAGTTPGQAADCLAMVRKPAADPARAAAIWAREVLPLAGAYEMNPSGRKGLWKTPGGRPPGVGRTFLGTDRLGAALRIARIVRGRGGAESEKKQKYCESVHVFLL